jgi:hypothetical protein
MTYPPMQRLDLKQRTKQGRSNQQINRVAVLGDNERLMSENVGSTQEVERGARNLVSVRLVGHRRRLELGAAYDDQVFDLGNSSQGNPLARKQNTGLTKAVAIRKEQTTKTRS